MPLDKETLLKPRFKVILYFPYCQWQVGDILTLDSEGFWSKDDGAAYVEDSEIKKCPKIFKLLKWWQEREISDLPLYLKSRHKRVVEIKYESIDSFFPFIIDGKHCLEIPARYFPATEQEYQQYIKP